MVWANRGFGKMKEEEGIQYKPSSAARVAHASLLLSGSDGRVWADWGFGKIKEDESSQWTPSSAAHVAHAPPLLFGSDGRDQGFGKTKEEETILMSWVMR